MNTGGDPGRAESSEFSERPDEVDPAPGWQPSVDHLAAAEAIRRLNHAVMERFAPDADFAACVDQLGVLAEQLERSPIRQRSRPAFVNHMSGAVDSADSTEWSSAFIDSPYCGDINAVAPPLVITREDRTAVGRVTCRRPYQGAPARVHGGVVAGLVDDVMGAVLGIEKIMAFTGELTIRYESGCPTDMPLEFRAWATGQDGRKLFIRCEGHSELGLFVTGTATFITIEEMATPTAAANLAKPVDLKKDP